MSDYKAIVLEGEIDGTEKMIEDISEKIDILQQQKHRLTYVVEVFKSSLEKLSDEPQQGEMSLENSSSATES